MKNISNLKNKYYESYCDSKSLLPGLKINWMEQLRDQAIHQFNQDGLPDKNVEEWNIYSFKGLTETFYNPFEKLNYDLDVDLIEKKKDNCLIRVIFYNGKIIKIEHDILPQGIKVNTLNFFLKNDPEFLKEKIKPANEFLEDRLSRITDSRPQSIVALNAAFHKEGAVICIDKNIKVPGYIELLQLGTSNSSSMKHIRSVLYIDEGAECEVLENIKQDENNNLLFTSNVSDIHISKGAVLSFHRFIEGNSNNLHINNVHVNLDKDAKFINSSFINSKGQVRAETRVNLKGENSSSKIDSLMIGTSESLHETLTKVRHIEKNTKSNQIIRTILDDKSKGSFQGKIRVDIGADGTQANMSGKSLLLSDNCRVNSKPELEILADDVSCSHGVTVGNLSEEQLFYLCSRGIPENEARRLLINAFGKIVINSLSPSLSTRAEKLMLENNN